MGEKTKETLKIFLKILSGLLGLLILIVAVMFFPQKGKKHLEVWAASDDFSIDSIRFLEKEPGRPFKILQLSDTQLWSLIGDNNKCLKQIKELVEKTQPDLIITVGDNVSGAGTRFDIRRLIKLLDSFDIPWAAVFGNHDNEVASNSLNWQGDLYEAAENCIFKKGPSNLYGCGNYVLNIKENEEFIQSLFLLDNGRYMTYSDRSRQEVYMGYEQIAWYEWNVLGLKEYTGQTVPSMVFTHFPPPQMRKAIEKYAIHDEATGRYNVPADLGSGYCAYLPSSAPVDSGFFDKCLSLGSTKHMFFGHDHESNASITYEGITMTFGTKTGPSPRPWNSAKALGGTLISIDTKDGEAEVSFSHIVVEKRE